MMWIIIILMFVPINSTNDALEVTHLNNKLLQFSSVEKCYEHIATNLEELKSFANDHFENVPIAKIDCFQKPLEA